MTGAVADLDGMMAIMAAAFAPRFGEAWTRRQMSDALVIGNCHHVLIEHPKSLIAAGFFLSRTGYEEEELLLLAVLPEARRGGLGLTLLERFRDDARARGARRLLLEMRRGNPAQSLYQTFGFTPIGMRPNYYRTADGDRIDAITFACRLD